MSKDRRVSIAAGMAGHVFDWSSNKIRRRIRRTASSDAPAGPSPKSVARMRARVVGNVSPITESPAIDAAAERLAEKRAAVNARRRELAAIKRAAIRQTEEYERREQTIDRQRATIEIHVEEDR